MPKELITAEEARQLFHYNPETGDLTWKVSRGRIASGRIVRTRHNHGYYSVRINRGQYLVHRVIWLIVHGRWPTEHIDHANGVRTDNRLCNLREATRSENQWNQAISRRNKSGFKGVFWAKHANKWEARVEVSGKRQYLGRYDTREEAHAAYCKAAKELHGEFANTG